MGLIHGALAALPMAVPVDPDSPQAQQWIIGELSKPQYRAAQPTWFDRLSTAVVHWFQTLRIGTGLDVQLPILITVGVIILGALVAAFFIFGPPRLNRRSTAAGALFGTNDDRDAASIRSAAETAAKRGEWSIAIEEMFRCLARGLAERTILTVTPGTTAHDFAVRAGRALPSFTERLRTAASAFDDVRYLDLDGTEEAFRAIAALEGDIRAARPALAPVSAAMSTR